MEQAASQSGDNIEKRMLVTQRDNALDALKIKAAELRKANPELTESQAFAKVYRIRPIARWPLRSDRRVCRPCTPLSNSMLLVAHRISRAVVLRFRRDCLAGGGMSSRHRPLFLLGF